MENALNLNLKNSKQVKKEKKLAKKKEKKAIRYKPTKSITITFIYLFRLCMIAYWIIVPIFFALIFYYDPGVKPLFKYVVMVLFAKISIVDGEYIITNDVEKLASLLIWIITPSIWFVSFLLIYLFVYKPFFKKKTYGKRAYLAFRFFFWSILSTALIYIIWFSIDFLPHKPSEGIGNGFINPSDKYWSAAKENFSPWNGWMIFFQCIQAILLFFGIYTAIEADLIRRRKLDFNELFKSDINDRSIVNQVLEGRLEFGQYDSASLKKDLKELKSKMKEEEVERKIKQYEKEDALKATYKLNKKNGKDKKNTKL